ncbi:polyprenol reductase 1-like [Selaginella moellendorffii]|nr:polyprenol reductase 1 [Selaginella moellendorffii]XP_024536225.1 polyprenol reductase 1-like [Selaginella moellendorffii]|eukprot:XP_024534416.1 polyprenol reductase 1 [Selaginella moellendorffii]
MLVSLTFALLSLNLFYAQEIAEAMCYQPTYNTMWLGVVVFMVGIVGNFYHHCILARIRNSAEGLAATARRDSITTKKYIVPHGGLFDKVACPQYLFEIGTFIGISMISQTTMSLACAVFVMLYLTARSFSTRDWYVQKLEGFPKTRKALIPNVL